MKTYETMPEDLPRPIDDGACDHLIRMKLPDIDLLATGRFSCEFISAKKKDGGLLLSNDRETRHSIARRLGRNSRR